MVAVPTTRCRAALLTNHGPAQPLVQRQPRCGTAHSGTVGMPTALIAGADTAAARRAEYISAYTAQAALRTCVRQTAPHTMYSTQHATATTTRNVQRTTCNVRAVQRPRACVLTALMSVRTVDRKGMPKWPSHSGLLTANSGTCRESSYTRPTVCGRAIAIDCTHSCALATL